MNKKTETPLTITNSPFFQSVEDYLKEKGYDVIHNGKVRNTYTSPVTDKTIISVATDRISAFDVVAKQGIPYKGQILNMLAAYFLAETADVCPNWLSRIPNQNTSIGIRCKPFKIEMVIRGYLAGSAARDYKKGEREICGIRLPDGMKENEKFASPIITPTTKADEGHDENISKAEIISRGLATAEQYAELEEKTRLLFQRGTEMAAERGLILVDTKYEFGLDVMGVTSKGNIFLIDEIHTPDSSRFWEADAYQENFEKGLPQKQLSKEFFREWLLSVGYDHESGGPLPEILTSVANEISKRYVELYERLTGQKFVPQEYTSVEEFIVGF